MISAGMKFCITDQTVLFISQLFLDSTGELECFLVVAGRLTSEGNSSIE